MKKTLNKTKSLCDWRANSTELFEKDENPMGQYIKIDNIYFQVIGVHKFVPGGGFESDGDILFLLKLIDKFIIQGRLSSVVYHCSL